MAGRRTAPAVILSEIERSELTGLAGRRKTAQAMAMRARIVLTCAEGLQSKQVAAKLGVDEATVGKWRRRFAERCLDGLYDEPAVGDAAHGRGRTH
jgi:transposase-like protein